MVKVALLFAITVGLYLLSALSTVTATELQRRYRQLYGPTQLEHTQLEPTQLETTQIEPTQLGGGSPRRHSQFEGEETRRNPLQVGETALPTQRTRYRPNSLESLKTTDGLGNHEQLQGLQGYGHRHRPDTSLASTYGPATEHGYLPTSLDNKHRLGYGSDTIIPQRIDEEKTREKKGGEKGGEKGDGTTNPNFGNGGHPLPAKHAFYGCFPKKSFFDKMQHTGKVGENIQLAEAFENKRTGDHDQTVAAFITNADKFDSEGFPYGNAWGSYSVPTAEDFQKVKSNDIDCKLSFVIMFWQDPPPGIADMCKAVKTPAIMCPHNLGDCYSSTYYQPGSAYLRDQADDVSDWPGFVRSRKFGDGRQAYPAVRFVKSDSCRLPTYSEWSLFDVDRLNSLCPHPKNVATYTNKGVPSDGSYPPDATLKNGEPVCSGGKQSVYPLENYGLLGQSTGSHGSGGGGGGGYGGYGGYGHGHRPHTSTRLPHGSFRHRINKGGLPHKPMETTSMDPQVYSLEEMQT